MDDQTERRKYPRKNVCWPISLLTDTGIVEGETVDISVEGISINIEDPVPLDEILRICIEPDGHEVIEVSGRVTWSDLYGIDDEDHAIGMGVCFLEISDQDRHFLEELVSEASET